MMNAKNPSLFLYLLAAFCIVCFVFILVILCFHVIPQANSQILYVLLGTFGSFSAQAINYFFGTSKSSADKTDLLANSTPNQVNRNPIWVAKDYIIGEQVLFTDGNNYQSIQNTTLKQAPTDTYYWKAL